MVRFLKSLGYETVVGPRKDRSIAADIDKPSATQGLTHHHGAFVGLLDTRKLSL